MKSEATAAAAARQECVGSVGHRVPVDFARWPPRLHLLVSASGSRVPVVFSVPVGPLCARGVARTRSRWAHRLCVFSPFTRARQGRIARRARILFCVVDTHTHTRE
jgi:hypothetical protein